MALLGGVPFNLYSQDRLRSMDGAVGIYDNSNPNLSLYASFTYTWWFNKYFGVAAGGMFLKSDVDESWTVKEKRYYLSDKIFNINAIGEVKFALPIVWRFGIFSDAQFMFEPIPFAYISLDSSTGEGVVVKDSEKYLFTKFNPSALLNGGLYYDVVREKSRARFSLGVGRGYYDVLNAYRRATINGQKLSNHLPSKDEPVTNVFLKVSVFM